jgi:hypothetical protein
VAALGLDGPYTEPLRAPSSPPKFIKLAREPTGGNVKRVALIVFVFVSLVASGASSQQSDRAGDPMQMPEPPILGPHIPRGQASAARRTSSPDLLWHNGQILTSSLVKAIYWGSSWSNSTFVGDKISGLDTFYSGVSGSSYMNTNTEYTGTNGQVSSVVMYDGHTIDLGTAPARAPKTSAVLAEVCKVITNPVPNGFYPVYADTPRGHAGYCAWHSYGSCGGVPVQFGWFFNLDGDPGCDPGDTSGLHSQGLAALANVSGHELSETVTDPRNGGWYDSGGAENADKCAWTFNGLETLGATKWLIQGNWSNQAYDNGQTGYTLGGCINGE